MYGYKLGLKKIGESVPAAPANVVQPFLSGSGAVDTVVTSSSGTWTGFPTPTFNYDFKLNTVSVQSGASNTFTPGSINEGETLTVTVTATNSQGSANADSSNSLVVGVAPKNTVAPSIFGDNTFGSTLTTTDGTFTGTAPINYSYQWQRGDSPISGQTANTYVIGSSDSLANITCVVTGSNSYGSDSEVSNTITVVDFAPVNTVAPTVSPSGTQVTGTLITSNVGTWAGVTPITYEYKWTRNGVAISGATASTYTIQSADDGTTIRVEVKGSNTYGESAFVASSNSVSAVNAVAPSNTVAPVISGTAVVGQVLSSTTGTWTGTPTPTYSYQWKRGATNIGTNSSTYTLVQADAGNTSNITCVVTATNSAGSANATSNTIAQILDGNANTYLINSTNDVNATFKSAINQFVIDLKTNNLWSKMNRIYPFLGGTSSKCATDLVTGVNGTFSGTFTYSANGPLPNGTNAFFDTGFNATSLTANSNHLSFDSFTNNAVAIDYDMGVATNGTAGTNLLDMFLRRSNGTVALDAGNFPSGRVSSTSTDSIAYFVGSITAINDRRIFRNATQLNISTTSFAQTFANGNIYVFALNDLTPPFMGANPFGSKGSKLATIGAGLTAAEVTTLQTIRSTFQTAVSR
jgi:hypothetical protein